MAILSSETIHATSVAIEGRGVLLMGPSGCGKSDLALRLIDRGASLVSDDYTLLVRQGRALVARPPATIAGKIEVRDVGLFEMSHVNECPVALVIALDAEPERLPDPGATMMRLGISVPLIALDGRHASAPIKVEFALARALERIAAR